MQHKSGEDWEWACFVEQVQVVEGKLLGYRLDNLDDGLILLLSCVVASHKFDVALSTRSINFHHDLISLCGHHDGIWELRQIPAVARELVRVDGQDWGVLNLRNRKLIDVKLKEVEWELNDSACLRVLKLDDERLGVPIIQHETDRIIWIC